VTKERLALARMGEDLALETVKSRGYEEIEKNYTCPLGEIDLIAREGDTLVFLEIKTRRGRSTGYAKEAVDARKRRQLSRVALFYMKENDCIGQKARFDVVAISVRAGDVEVEVIRNAFDLAY